MSVRVTTYRNGTSGDPVNRRDDIAAKALAATTNCDAVRVYEEGRPVRYYVLNQADGRNWDGPYGEERFSATYGDKIFRAIVERNIEAGITTIIATAYRDGKAVVNKEVASDLAAKMLGGRNTADAVGVHEIGRPTRYYALSQTEGRYWMGPYDEERFVELYGKRIARGTVSEKVSDCSREVSA